MLATMPRKKPPVEKEQVNIRMTAALLDRLDRLGEPYGITRTTLITQAVIEFVERREQERGHQPDQQKPHRKP